MFELNFMNKNGYKIFLLVVFIIMAYPVNAKITLPKVLGSNMVLQRNKPLPIWGTASGGELITVSFRDQTKSTRTDNSGRWEIILDPLEASFEPAEMIISGENIIFLKNILVGEVWLCSGQSNMAYSMNKSSKYANARKSKGLSMEELQETDNPNMRVFQVKRSLYENNDINRGWGWEDANFGALKGFSAVGYFFAKKLQDELGVPVGIISSAVSGSAIERWAPEEIFSGNKNFNAEVPKPPEEIDELNGGKFYYSMIQPLSPFAMRGFLWYQGETNCFKQETFEYTDKMQVLIHTWRTIWGDQEMPFYYVQIAPFKYSGSEQEPRLTEETLSEFWEAQAAALKIPNTGMVVTTDLVDNLDDIHPTYKWEVGKRLALLALGKSYNQNRTIYSGPVFQSMKINGNELVITFAHAGSGLTSRDGKSLDWFSVASDNGDFVPAQAVIRGNEIVVSAKKVSSPVDVRFAWNEAAQPNLINKEGLPAMPFRTDGLEWQTRQ